MDIRFEPCVSLRPALGLSSRRELIKQEWYSIVISTRATTIATHTAAAVAPAVVKTYFAQALYAAGEDQTARSYPLRRLGMPDAVAHAVAYLVSEKASWITGQTFILDGGVTLTGGH